LARVGKLSFQAVDEQRFPAMQLVKQVMQGEDSLAIAMNAANEVANQAFRERRIGFMDIVNTVRSVLDGVENIPVGDLDAVWLHDEHARKLAAEVIGL